MPYKYKEPETWDELFDALDSVATRWPVCPEFKKWVTKHNPKNLSSLKQYHHKQVQYVSIWKHIVIWWNTNMKYTMGVENYCRRMTNPPTARDIAALRKFLRSKLKEAHRVHG